MSMSYQSREKEVDEFGRIIRSQNKIGIKEREEEEMKGNQNEEYYKRIYCDETIDRNQREFFRKLFVDWNLYLATKGSSCNYYNDEEGILTNNRKGDKHDDDKNENDSNQFLNLYLSKL